MKDLIKLIIRVLSAPFAEKLHVFLFLWIAASLVEFVAWVCYGNIPFALYLSLHGFIMSYCLCLICSALDLIPLPQIINKVLYVLILILCCVNVVVDVVCHYNFHFGFTSEVVDVIRGTNPGESVEFIQTFLTAIPVACCIAVFAVGGMVIFFRKRIKSRAMQRRGLFAGIGIFILLGSYGVTLVKKSNNWNGIFINKVCMLINGQSISAPDLCLYQHTLDLDFEESSLPKKIVIIIGESHSSRHSSLYGYTKQTEPLLGKREKENSLFVYPNVQSPAIGTVTAFVKILNSSMLDGVPDSLWYKSRTIFDVAKSLGYKTIWISNQDRKGLYDNIPASYSYLCDTSVWAGKKFMDAGRMNVKGNYDESLLTLYDDSEGTIEKQLYIYHLMGSHEAFKNRYPDEFEKFTGKDYDNKPENQRDVLAAYDNSIVYNDYVVDRIINKYANDDAVIFYFSDHSIDVFDSSESFYGHARPSESKSVAAGKDIPFIIYLSDSYKDRSGDIVEKIIEDMKHPFNTGYFFSKFCFILGVEFKNQEYK